jgi:hypothetical protein
MLDPGTYKNYHRFILAAVEFYETVSILMMFKLEVWLNVLFLVGED